jgi:hypothetical protein
MPTPIASRFTRTGDTYLLEDTDLAGGYRSVSTIAARDNIPLSARRIGMAVYCVADKTEYLLLNALTNASWAQRPLFSGKAHAIAQVVAVDPLQQYTPLTFEQYAMAKVREWFNGLPSANRVLNKPIYYFKIVCGTGTASLAAGTILPPPAEYIGDATFIYDNAANTLPVILDNAALVCISKTLVPLGDAVIRAMDEYADRKASEAP